MSDTLIGVYQNLNGQSINVQQLINAFSPTLGADVPSSLAVTLQNASVVWNDTNALFAVAIDGGVNLANLPLVGPAFTQSQSLQFNIQVNAAQGAWTQQALQALNTLIPSPAAPLPAPASGIAQGVSALCTLTLGSDSISVPITYNDNGPSAPAPSTIGDSTSTINWYPVQKSFGPLVLQQVGVGFDSSSGTLTLYLDANISISGLQITLDALGISTPLQQLDPSLSLQGLGISYSEGDFELSAALLNAGGDVFAGSAMLGTSSFSISAIGAYAPDANGSPSLVVYAYVGGFAAGPPCFTVEGLAVGFGYNRGLNLPTLSTVSSFPLVSAVSGNPDPMSAAGTAMQSPQQSSGLTAALNALNQYFPPSEGLNFAAFGVKFSSFEMAQAFVLLSVAFGQDFSLDLIGLATAAFPIPDDDSTSPLAQIQVALLASWQPSLGSFLLQAQLTSASYILSQSCKLTGGLDFALWYGDSTYAGDFVFTAGGYNPAFNVPSYYPTPVPLGLQWQVASGFSIIGTLYFALCPHALMAGAKVEALWSSGDLSANFQMAFDVLIGWKPFYYSMSLSESLSIEYHGSILGISVTISLELGAALSIWGPDFTGTATIDVEGIGFTLNFGDAAPGGPTPLLWPQFQSSFLPASNGYWTHAVGSGAVPSTVALSAGDLGLINPKDFALTISSLLPLASITGTNAEGTGVGIAPMALSSDDVSITATVAITQNGTDVTSTFSINGINQSVPAGLWGSALVPSVNDPTLIQNGLTGCSILPAAQPVPGTTAQVPVPALQSDPIVQASAFVWSPVTIPAVTGEDDSERRTDIANSLSNIAGSQTQLLSALGLSSLPVDCSPTIGQIFNVAPQIVAA